MLYNNDVEAAEALHQKFNELKKEISKVIVGQNHVVEALLISIFSNGHTLMIGLPGLAKTLLVKTLSEVLDLNFNRIQFTPDLMPSDITGTEILNEKREFQFLKGPIFSNIILADEINRTPPKTQAALLEAMQEKAVTINGQLHVLPNPFFVLATQNPIEQEGTYSLPEAQLDRFMFNILLDYPSFADEVEIVKATTSNKKVELSKIIHSTEILAFQELVRKAPVADNVIDYAVKLVSKTRPQSEFATDEIKKYVDFGAGPRAGQFLIIGAKAHALIHGKYSPDIENVKAIAKDVLRHRIIKNYRAEAEGIKIEDLIEGIL
ncbi:MAG: MoxR family ATPase [Bacteroidota bacterium]|jgi:MoxR-like ATPase